MALGRAHVIFRGRVQGVFFRAFTEEVANSYGLSGWVRNTADGSVEAVFEGERAEIEKAIAVCEKGPPAAQVDHADVSWEPYKGESQSFRVRYF